MKVELKGIHKHFGAVYANNNIHLTIPSGSIQGILGENGAGKSTLMKVLSGFIQADAGEILLDDKKVAINSPSDAIQNGIGMLHQDPLDFPPMKVVDNFIVGSLDNGENVGFFPNRKKIAAEIQTLQSQFNFSLDPNAYIDSLTVGERQQVEILRLLWVGASVLILDEPTTGISAIQKQKLFETLRKLAAQGKTIIFVSHKLEDIEQLCDRVAVLRRGTIAGEAIPPYDITALVNLMFGKVISFGERQVVEIREPVISLEKVSTEGVRVRTSPVELEVRAGEVIGLAGLEGSGQELFLRCCGGLIRPVEGKVRVNSHDLTGKNYHRFREDGVAFMPASRMEEGLIPGLTLSEHFLLAREQKGLFVDREFAQNITEEQINEFNIRGTGVTRVENLSGGNQQRALLALLNAPLSLILMEHPTRGLDIESANYIWSKLKERCRQGTSIIFISSDLDELLLYSDRILVFFAGRVSTPLDAATTTVDQLGQLIGGKGW